MNISSFNAVSYSDLTSGSMAVKGQTSGAKEQGAASAASSSSATDTVSLSTYSIGGSTVSKSEFEKYDTNGDGKISSAEQEAYEKDQQTVTENTESEEASSVSETDNAEIISQLTMTAASAEETLLGGLGNNFDLYA